MRQNVNRINGQFERKIDGIDSFAAETVNTLADRYPNIDLIDLGWQFETQFRFEIARRMAREAHGSS